MGITAPLVITAALLSPVFMGHAYSPDGHAWHRHDSRVKAYHSDFAGRLERLRSYRQETASFPPKETTPTVQPTPTGAPVPTKTASNASFQEALAQSIHTLTNNERAKVGLPTLAWDGKLASIADAHSEDMAAKNYFSHTNLAGCSASCRLKDAGYFYSYMGENIAWISGRPLTDALASQFVILWMNSPGHKANILSKNFTSEGVGIAVIGTKVYATADFAKPR